MLRAGSRCVRRRHDSKADLLVRYGVIPREQIRLAAADQITARIAYVSDGSAVVAQGTGDERRRHARASRTRRVTCINHARVRSLDETLEKRRMCFAWERLAKAFQHALHRGVRRDLSEIVTTHTIGHGEKPAARASFLRRRRSYVPEIIFISLTHSTNVRELRELDIHGVLEQTLAFGDLDPGYSRCLKTSIH